MSRKDRSYRRLPTVSNARASSAHSARRRLERTATPRRIDATVAPGTLAMRTRVRAVLLIFFLGWGLLLVRAGYLTVGADERLSNRLTGQHERVVSVAPKRGSIVDRLGRPLAVSIELESVYADPGMVDDPAGAAELLAPVLGIEREALLARLTREGTRFVWLARQLEEHVADAVRELDLPGVRLTEESDRKYPGGPLAASILGFTGTEGVGLEGLEARFDEVLTGEKFEYKTIRDRLGRATTHGGVLARRSTEGNTLVLTIDHSIQHRAEVELASAIDKYDANAGWAVVMEADTGAVLAMASLPSFDPNAFRGVDPSTYRHRALEEIFEPGSTLKPFVVAEALELGLATSEESIFCENGLYRLGRNVVHDHVPHGYLSVEEILEVSSNIGLAKLGERMGPEKLEAMYRRYGFASKTPIELRDEAGILRPSSSWSRIGFATHTFGQGMAVTGIQQAMAFSALVNGGMEVRPHLVKEIRDRHENTQPLARNMEPLKRVLSEKTSTEIRRIMGGVVEEGGTAPIAKLAEYSSGGKTGTAQKVKDGRYAKGLYVSSFIGFAPLDKPKVVTLVVLDEPKKKWYGGTVAGPVFREVTTHALRELGVVPDLEKKEAEAAARAAAEGLLDSEDAPKTKKKKKVLAATRLKQTAQSFTDRDNNPLPVLAAADAGWTMPDLSGRPLRDVVKIFGASGVDLKMEGFGLVTRQKPSAGALLMPDDTVTIALSTNGRGGLGR